MFKTTVTVEYTLAVLHLLLRLIKRYWYIVAILVIFMLYYGWIAYLNHKRSIPLKSEGDFIVESLFTWWNTPERNDGAGRKPLDQIYFSSFYLNNQYFMLLEEKQRLIIPESEKVREDVLNTLINRNNDDYKYDGESYNFYEDKTRITIMKSNNPGPDVLIATTNGTYLLYRNPPYHINLRGSRMSWEENTYVHFDINIDLSKDIKSTEINVTNEVPLSPGAHAVFLNGKRKK